MTHVERHAPKFILQVVRIRRKGARPIAIAAGFAERVVGSQVELRCWAQLCIEDQQVLSIVPGGFKVVDIERIAEWPDACRRHGRVQVPRTELMQTSRLDVADAERRVVRQTALDADGRSNVIRFGKIRNLSPDRLRL